MRTTTTGWEYTSHYIAHKIQNDGSTKHLLLARSYSEEDSGFQYGLVHA